MNLQSLLAKKQLLEKQRDSLLSRKSKLDEQLIKYKKVLALFTNVSKEIQQEFSLNVSSLITKCLNIVFVEDYEFQMLFSSNEKSTAVEFKLLKNGNEQDLLSATGGGVCDVVAVALRLALHQMKKPRSRNTIVLDESFKCLRGVENISRVYQMLELMSKTLNLQIIMINNANENLELVEKYNVIFLENDEGVSIVKSNN